MTFYTVQYREKNRRKYRDLSETLYTEQEAREELNRLQEQTSTLVFRITPAETCSAVYLTV